MTAVTTSLTERSSGRREGVNAARARPSPVAEHSDEQIGRAVENAGCVEPSGGAGDMAFHARE